MKANKSLSHHLSCGACRDNFGKEGLESPDAHQLVFSARVCDMEDGFWEIRFGVMSVEPARRTRVVYSCVSSPIWDL